VKNKLVWLQLLLVIAPFIAVAMVWNQASAQVPIHWNIHGEIDGWGSKPLGLLLAPILGLVTVLLLRVVSWLDPKLRRSLKPSDRMNRILQILRILFVAFFDIVLFVQIAAALNHPLPTVRIMNIAVLVLLAVIGNYLGNLRPNYFVGIRTPWTLENTETWRATHRLGGRLMFFGSIVLLILQFLVSEQPAAILLVIGTLALVSWAFVYSWCHFRMHARETA
jgi:uncharacterized membrane protein